MLRMRIVVGVDGSQSSLAAVRWAAAEAELRDAELRVLTAYQRQAPGQQGDSGAASIVHEAVGQARSVAPGIDVRGMAHPGYAAPMLLHAAEEAALLVVGDRARGSVPGQPAGSVGSQVATQARTSVVVVRGRRDCDTGPVVVGIDSDAAGEAIVERAFEEAAIRGAPVLAVTAGDGPRPTAKEALGTDLDGHLERWRQKFPHVHAEHEYVSGRPDQVLVDRCEQARLVVVGPRRHGYEGVLLGTVGSRLLRRADCPVLIAR